jgi:phosphatidylserine/phosphatidylglycerophosphate/cardiolipin synthase-like enzyme
MLDPEFIELFKTGRIESNQRSLIKALIQKQRDKGTKSFSGWQRALFDLAAQTIADGARAEVILDILYSLTQITDNLSQQDEFPAVQSAFSPGPACKNLILGELQRAEASLDLCVFTISDDELTRTIAAAHHNGVKVRILTDNDKSLDAGSDINLLADEGIEIRVDQTENHMHHKFMIRDKKSLLTGSYNWTRSAERFNQENVLLIQDAGVVQPYQNEFTRLWHQLPPY